MVQLCVIIAIGDVLGDVFKPTVRFVCLFWTTLNNPKFTGGACFHIQLYAYKYGYIEYTVYTECL